MAEKPEDLNLPSAVVQRMIKEALPDGINVSKDARQSISRASSVFVLYLTACSVTHANKAKRKTLAVNDILAALKDMEFASFIPLLNEFLESRREVLKASTNKKQDEKALAVNKSTVDDENLLEEIEEVTEEASINMSVDETKSKKRRIMETDASSEPKVLPDTESGVIIEASQ